MTRLNLIIAFFLAVLAGNAIAQAFPSKPLTLICPFPANGSTDSYFRALAPITAKYLGQEVIVVNRPGRSSTIAPTSMAASERADGYYISMLPITVFRVPHIEKVSWDPLKDFSYVIGLAGYTFGMVVKSDSEIRTLANLIAYAKANPGKLVYGTTEHGGSPHLNMEELGRMTGAKFRHEPIRGTFAINALMEGRVQVLSDSTAWGPQVDSGAVRLLVTFGERRSRWNAPTASELGLDILSYSPFGIVGPKGMDPKVTKRLHDAFYRALDDPEYDKLIKRLDFVDWYKSSEDYAEWAVDQFKFQRGLIERTIGLGR